MIRLLTMIRKPRRSMPSNADDTLSIGDVTGLLANDTDVDNGADVTVNSNTSPTTDGDSSLLNVPDGTPAGTVTVGSDGGFDYDPAGTLDGLVPGETVTVTFTYDAIDEELGVSNTATATIVVTGVDDAPVAGDDTATTDEDTCDGPDRCAR